MPPVTIHSRQPAVDPADPDGLRPALRVTYSTPTVPPRTVFVPGEDPTDDQVSAVIRADLDDRRAEPAGSLEV